MNFKVGDQVPPLEQYHEERQRVVQHVPAEVPPGPQTKGQVEVQGVMYQWNVTSEGLQLVPIKGSKPEASRARSSQDTSGSIFTSRARSPFTPVNPKASNKQLVNRTPSPNRYRGVPSSWQEQRRAASRSPARVSTPGSAPGRIMAAATRQLFEGPRNAGVPSGLEGSRAAVPPRFEGFPNVGGLVAKFEAQGSPESVRSPKNRRVQMQVPEPQPQTPRIIKPTIAYPCSPGGTEIRPPTSTPPKTPLTASPVQDTASAQSAQGLEYRWTIAQGQ